MGSVRIQIADTWRNLYYLYRHKDGHWDMMLANGIPYSMSGLFQNAALTKFALQDAGDNPEVIVAAVKVHLKHDYPVEVVDQSAITSKGMLTEQQKDGLGWILAETIDLSVERRDGLKKEDATSEFESITRVLDFLKTRGADMSAQRLALGSPRF